jgi:F-type H+-transporting ATPase subunit b
VLTAVVTSSGSSIEVSFLEGAFVGAEEGEEEVEVPESDLNPIFPELKEVAWGFGSFVILFVVLRLFLLPKVQKGMKSRYDTIHDDFDTAETLTASARADVAEYEAQVASVRADAQTRVEAARATLEAERAEKLGGLNARIADKRAAAAAEVDAARVAALPEVEAAVADVAELAGRLATGTQPSSEAVTFAVRAAMGQEVPA